MLTYKMERNEGTLFVTVVGIVNGDSVDNFQEMLDHVMRKSPEKIVFKLNSLEFINSAGIGKLLVFYKKSAVCADGMSLF